MGRQKNREENEIKTLEAHKDVQTIKRLHKKIYVYMYL